MKISLPKSFDPGAILESIRKAKIDGFGELFTYVEQLATEVSNALRGTLTFRENFNCEVKEIDLKHNVALRFTLDKLNQKKTPTGILVTKVFPFNNALTAPLAWQITQDGQIEVKASFTGSPESPVTVSMVVLF